MISVETYVLCRGYTDKAIENIEESAMDKAVTEAVTIAKKYTDQQAAVGTWKIKFVDILPPIAEAESKTIYFVPLNAANEDSNYYYEYIEAEKQWELIGTTEFRPEDYVTKQEVVDYVNEHQYILQPASNVSLGGIIVDEESIDVDANGKISVVPIGTNDIANLFH